MFIPFIRMECLSTSFLVSFSLEPIFFKIRGIKCSYQIVGQLHLLALWFHLIEVLFFPSFCFKVVPIFKARVCLCRQQLDGICFLIHSVRQLVALIGKLGPWIFKVWYLKLI